MRVDIEKVAKTNTEILVKDITEFNLMMDALKNKYPSLVKGWLYSDGSWMHYWTLWDRNTDVSEVYFITTVDSLLWGHRNDRTRPSNRRCINLCDLFIYDEDEEGIDIEASEFDFFDLMSIE